MDSQKQEAIDLHTRQASEFEDRYRQMASNPYASTFTYGRMLIEEMIEAEIARLPKGARALDVGCGTGFNIARLRARGVSAAGVEPADGMREIARAHNPDADIRAGVGDALPFDDDSFDFVLSIEVIRYLADPAAAVAEMRRVLKPGGVALITAAPLLSLNGYAAINAVTSRVSVPTFTRIKHTFHTVRSLRETVLDSGFREAEVHGRFLGPWHALGRVSPALLSKLLETLEPLDRKLADTPLLRDLSNHLIVTARK